MRLIKVNNKTFLIDKNATGAEIQVAARSHGFGPILKGAGGVVELRAYTPSGGALLVKDNQQPIAGLRDGKWTYKIHSFSFTSVERSNRIGSGRSSYFPASAGRLNPEQISAAVGDTRIWRRHLVLNAPRFFMDRGTYPGPDWTVDQNSVIIQNAAGVQYDDGFTLSTDDGEKLIALMKAHADSRRQGWASRPAAPPPPRVRNDRDRRILAAMRTYTGKLDWRKNWPWLRPLRKHAGMPDITAADRRRLWPVK